MADTQDIWHINYTTTAAPTTVQTLGAFTTQEAANTALTTQKQYDSFTDPNNNAGKTYVIRKTTGDVVPYVPPDPPPAP